MSLDTPAVRTSGTEAAVLLAGITADERRAELAARHERHLVHARVQEADR